ncbi:response regulator transcription factor [Polynucleobacter sp. MWH-Loch1C5]|uniref:response regulator transcription factor n=1 Tax=Polynucleobacter sp. MWH-Loch1C5 TaxID=2689108 RepID=UPI00351D4419
MSAGHIYLIDDDSSVRESISRMLKSYGFSVESYADPEDYLKQAIPVSPAAIILDVRMPGMSGVELHAKLNEMGRKTPIIYISGESMPHEIVTSMKQGAMDFLIKPFNLEDLLKAVQAALEVDTQTHQLLNQTISIQARYESLTPREKEVFELLVEGLMNKEIAVQLGTTNATIKVHKSRVMEKMQAGSLQELVRLHHRLS